eukprot:3924111-Rhodomonas_salina.2
MISKRAARMLSQVDWQPDQGPDTTVTAVTLLLQLPLRSAQAGTWNNGRSSCGSPQLCSAPPPVPMLPP